MKRQFNKKRFWIIVALIALVEALTLFCIFQWKYIFPSKEVSEIYTRYENVDEIAASFIKDYKVNDSVFVDVTMLEAKDSAGWAMLKQDFSVPELNAELQTFIDNGENPIFSRRIAKNGQPLKAHADTTNYDVLAISYYSHTLTLFHITNNDENQAVCYHNFDESINSK